MHPAAYFHKIFKNSLSDTLSPMSTVSELSEQLQKLLGTRADRLLYMLHTGNELIRLCMFSNHIPSNAYSLFSVHMMNFYKV